MNFRLFARSKSELLQKKKKKKTTQMIVSVKGQF